VYSHFCPRLFISFILSFISVTLNLFPYAGVLVAKLISKQANALFDSPRFVRKDDSDWSYWKEKEEGEGLRLRFKGQIQDWKIVLSEAMARLCEGKEMERLEQLDFREIDAFIRDRNSEAGWELSEEELKEANIYIQNIKIGLTLSFTEVTIPLTWFPGQFRKLSLPERIKTLKSLFQNPFVQNLYRGMSQPNLLDVEDLTVYLNVPYETEDQRGRLDDLHSWLAVILKEPDLNLIPE
jgi:hypothetical protein